MDNSCSGCLTQFVAGCLILAIAGGAFLMSVMPEGQEQLARSSQMTITNVHDQPKEIPSFNLLAIFILVPLGLVAAWAITRNASPADALVPGAGGCAKLIAIIGGIILLLAFLAVGVAATLGGG